MVTKGCAQSDAPPAKADLQAAASPRFVSERTICSEVGDSDFSRTSFRANVVARLQLRRSVVLETASSRLSINVGCGA